jgi:hypothetical protein
VAPVKLPTEADRQTLHVASARDGIVIGQGPSKKIRLTEDEALAVADALVDCVERVAARASSPSGGLKVAENSADKAGRP